MCHFISADVEGVEGGEGFENREVFDSIKSVDFLL